MKRIDRNKEIIKTKTNNKKKTTVLIIACVILLVVGLVFLMIEPIKRYNRQKIASEALAAVSEKIDSIETSETVDSTEEVKITYTVPATGNEVGINHGNTTYSFSNGVYTVTSTVYEQEDLAQCFVGYAFWDHGY